MDGTQSRVELPASEADLIRRATAREETAIRSIIRANNRRLYRIARSVVQDDSEAEDVLQEAYFNAFKGLPAFRGESSLATWLNRIVLNAAMQRLRQRTRQSNVAKAMHSSDENVIPFPGNQLDPERTMAQRELCHLVERAIDELPDEFRTVLIARVLEDMSIDETAQLLGLRPETVKTRLHRARLLLKEALADHMEAVFRDIFPFDGERCARVANAVIERLRSSRN